MALRCRLNDVCRTRLFIITGFAKLFDNRQILEIECRNYCDQSGARHRAIADDPRFRWTDPPNGYNRSCCRLASSYTVNPLFCLFPFQLFYPTQMALSYSYTCIPYYPFDYSGSDRADERLSSAEYFCMLGLYVIIRTDFFVGKFHEN